MAIIKCPECSHHISDKAPFCPSCGVEIAGKITKCLYCGEIYLKSGNVCPFCHKTNRNGNHNAINSYKEQSNDNAGPSTSEKNLSDETKLKYDNGQYESMETDKTIKDAVQQENNSNNGKKKKNKKSTLLLSIIISLMILGICFYKYNDALANKEREEYEFALKSDDRMILQTYLKNYKSAPHEHIDSINAHLQILVGQDKAWNDAVASGSKSVLKEFLETYPDSPHKQEATDKIDSIDWALCLKTKTSESYQTYVRDHPDGNHYDEALIALKKIKSSEVSIEEKEMTSNIFHKFFMSINTRDENRLTSDISEEMTLLGKPHATKDDVISFMNKLYKADVKTMTWTLSNDYSIQKEETGDGIYEYNINLMASQKVEMTRQTENINIFRINAKVNSNGKITDFSMTKIIE